MNFRDYRRIASAIARDGVEIVGDEEPHEYALTYSIGRYENGWPELALWTETEEAQAIAGSLLLNTASEPVNAGDRIRLPNHGLSWIAVPQPSGLSEDEPLCLEEANAYYGRRVPVLLLLPEIKLSKAGPEKSRPASDARSRMRPFIERTLPQEL